LTGFIGNDYYFYYGLIEIVGWACIESVVRGKRQMPRLIVAVLIVLLAAPAIAADIPTTEEQKTLYAIGLLVSRSLAAFNLTPAELEVVKQGLTDAGTGKSPAVDVSVYNAKVQELAKSRRKAQGEKQASVNKEFLEKAAGEKGAVKTGSGLVYLSLKEGGGKSPLATDTVKVNYRGTLPDGKEFDSSYKRGKPAEFRLDGVIKCWTEGLQRMKVGGKARLVCPSTLAYGEAGAGELILPGATLVFEVELVDVKK
jgi:FKBP-type peptidyl-prolyl cis-trans isomerase FkpA